MMTPSGVWPCRADWDFSVGEARSRRIDLGQRAVLAALAWKARNNTDYTERDTNVIGLNFFA
jgi:hypothetical protein